MSDREEVIKHLEIIQGVINRLAHASFLVKGWSMTILAAGMLFISRIPDSSPLVMGSFLIPVFGVWFSDTYFLWQERMFRGIYDDVRMQTSTNFEMNIDAQKAKPGCKYYHALFSITLLSFYLMEVFFVIAVMCILQRAG